MVSISVDPLLCKKCGTCVVICPQTIYFQNESKSIPELRHAELCFSCGQCVALCPAGSISHTAFSRPGCIVAVNPVLVPSSEQVLALIRTRRSVRAFSDKPVERECIEKIIDGARFAPSMHNTQSTKYIVIRDRETLHTIAGLTSRYLATTVRHLSNPLIRRALLMLARDEIAAALPLLDDFRRISHEGNSGKDTVLFNAPCLILFHADRQISFADVNATLALHNAALVACSLGLGSAYTGYVVSACQRDESIPRLVKLPKGHRIFGGLMLGYPRFGVKKIIERRPAGISFIG